MSIKDNLQKIREAVGDGVKIIAVTKTRSIDEIKEVLECGITDIGESRIQEAKIKVPSFDKLRMTNQSAKNPKSFTIHLIGRLQTNKVREAVRLFDVIQSVDKLELAQKISSECGKIYKTMPIFIQVNTSNEPQKGGIKPEELDDLIKQILELPNIRLEGLMTIAVDSEDENEVRKCFRLLNEEFKNTKNKLETLNSKLEIKWLSMGMSGDYKIAISEGANMVRIGSGIFG